MKVILYCCGSAGDVLPFVRVGAALVKQGYDALLLGHSTYDSLARSVGLNYQAYDSEDEYRAFLNDAALLNTPTGILRFLSQYSLPKVPRVVELMAEHAQANTLLLTPPLFDTAARIAVEKYHLKACWAFLAPIQVAAHQLKIILFEKVLGTQINQIRADLGMAVVNDWESWLAYSSPSLGLWPDWFAKSEPHWPKELQTVGFPVNSWIGDEQLPEGITSFLLAHPKPVLITGGTGAFLGEDFYQAAIDAVAVTGRSCLVVTPYKDLLPESMPDNCLWSPRLPFSRLMSQTAAVIHHGGIGTLAAAARAGVPQLILAYGADRPDNGRRLATLGIGAVEPPPRWQARVLSGHLNHLIQSDEVAEQCANIVHRIKAHDGASEIAQYIHQLVP